jgi:endoglucanase
VWNEDESISKTDSSGFCKRFGSGLKMSAALQLYITTKDAQYATVFKNAIWQALDRTVLFGMEPALQAIPYMDDEYKMKLKEYVVKYKTICDGYARQNPYAVPIATGGWGGSGGVVNFATTNYFANKFYPDVMGHEYVYKGLNYIFGCHPYSNISFVSSVGTKSKKVTYGNNRANFSFIAGGIVPGILIIKPDFPENKEDWPFFWGENEVTVGGCADYIFLANAVSALANSK